MNNNFRANSRQYSIDRILKYIIFGQCITNLRYKITKINREYLSEFEST